MKVYTDKPIHIYGRVVMPPGAYEVGATFEDHVYVHYDGLFVRLEKGECHFPVHVRLNVDIHPYYVGREFPGPWLQGMILPVVKVTVQKPNGHEMTFPINEVEFVEGVHVKTAESITEGLETSYREEALRKREADCQGPCCKDAFDQDSDWASAIWG